MKRIYLFDVGRTLWNSMRVVTDSWNEVLEERRESGILIVDGMRSSIGHTMDEVAVCISSDADPEEQRDVMEICMRHGINYLESHSGYFYPGVLRVFHALHESGKGLYIVSSHREGCIESLFEARNLSSGEDGVIRDFIYCSETRRPERENIKLILERNDPNPEEAVCIGDTETGQAAAAGTGVNFCHARYDFGQVRGASRGLGSLKGLLED